MPLYHFHQTKAIKLSNLLWEYNLGLHSTRNPDPRPSAANEDNA
jgi:hypothetical protein